MPTSGTSYVPVDFPRLVESGCLPGMQPKLLATLYEGRFYLSGQTPPELHARWKHCCDLVNQLACTIQIDKTSKPTHMTQQAILAEYFSRLMKKKWTSKEEGIWIMKKVAEELSWTPLELDP